MRHHSPKSLTTTLLLIAALSCASPVNLWAQDTPSQAQLTEAQRHADRGTEYFFNKDYSKALVEFFKGYDLSGNPLFLYNISLTYQKLEELDRALSAAEEALALPRIDPELQAALQARTAGIPSVQHAMEVAQAMQRRADKVVPPEEPAEEGGGLGALGWTGVALTAVGAGVLGYHIFVYDPDLETRFDDYKAAANRGDVIEYGNLKSELRDDFATGQALFYVGVGATSLGAVLLLADLLGGESDSANALRITPTEGGAHVGFHGSF